MIFDTLKKSTAISSSSDLASYLGLGYQSMSGVTVTPETAMKYSAVFSCIKVLSESVGMLPLHLYKDADKGRKKAKDHKLYSLLHDEPNTYQTAQEFKEMLVAHVCLRGNFYAYINRVRGEVRELLPFNPDAVAPILNDDYEVEYKVTYKNGTSDVLKQKDVFHIKGLTLDGFTGVSVIHYAKDSIGLGLATERHGSKLFSNGARPGGILSTDQKLQPDQVERIRDNWNDTQGGLENAHRTAILEGGLKWAAIGMTSEDSQFLETRKYQRSEVAGMFRVPPHMIGDLERSTNNNIEHQGQEFVTYSLMPYLTRIEQRVRKSLLNTKEKKEYFAKFNVSALVRGDMKTRIAWYGGMINWGLMSPNEGRELEDMNPRDGGDDYLTPMNMNVNGKPQEETPNDKK